MSKNTFVILSSIVVIDTVFASGEGSGHLSDLIPPLINSMILLTFLVIKLRAPLNRYFSDLSRKTFKSHHLATAREKEASLKIEELQQKLSQSVSEIAKIEKSFEKDLQKYEKESVSDMDQRIVKMEQDGQQTLESDNNNALKSLYTDLVESVFLSAKVMIDENSHLKGKITQKLLKGIDV